MGEDVLFVGELLRRDSDIGEVLFRKGRAWILWDIATAGPIQFSENGEVVVVVVIVATAVVVVAAATTATTTRTTTDYSIQCVQRSDESRTDVGHGVRFSATSRNASHRGEENIPGGV